MLLFAVDIVMVIERKEDIQKNLEVLKAVIKAVRRYIWGEHVQR